MPEEVDEKTQLIKKLLPAGAGLVVLLVAGVAGGQIAGFKIEPESCDKCGLKLAACNAREELLQERIDRTAPALEKAQEALIKAYQECPQ